MSRKLSFRRPMLLNDLTNWASLLNSFIAPLAEAPQTFADADTTPSVLGAQYFECANTGATSITFLDDGVPGQTVTIRMDANTTLVDSATLVLLGGSNMAGTSDDLVTL